MLVKDAYWLLTAYTCPIRMKTLNITACCLLDVNGLNICPIKTLLFFFSFYGYNAYFSPKKHQETVRDIYFSIYVQAV